jgi:hypothetical protein
MEALTIEVIGVINMHTVREAQARAEYYFEKAARLPRHRRKLRHKALAWLALATRTEEADLLMQAARISTHARSHQG